MNEKNVLALFSVLNMKEWCINMTGSVRRMTSIDNFDTGLVVFVDHGRSLWWVLEVSKDGPKEQDYFSSRDSGKNSDSVELSAATFSVLDLKTTGPPARQIAKPVVERHLRGSLP